MFTKMDFRWGYNNVRIKEGDEWKITFSILEGAFEPTVMFFGLANSLVIFQAIMNNLLRDIIETEGLVVFIDNAIVETETEKGYDNIVEQVLRRMVKNDLFVKPEKYV